MNALPRAGLSLEALCERLRARARLEDAGEEVSASVALLRQAHLLDDSAKSAPRATARKLMRVAAVNLSVARLLEGHMNALRLVETHGEAGQLFEMRELVRSGAFLGVWGADGDPPVRVADTNGKLAGRKKYASGLGTVTHAILSVDVSSQTRLCLIDVQDKARQDSQSWSMLGMRATRSGQFDVTGIDGARVMWIGPPDIYTSEPGFIGGVWRIAALQLGATLGLLEAAARKLAELGRLDAEAQMARLTPVVIRAMSAEGLTTKAAEFAESHAAVEAPERAVALSAAARLLTEEIGLQAITAAEQSLGILHFETDSESGRIARDLAVYMRQAARDALLLRVGKYVLRQPTFGDLMS